MPPNKESLSKLVHKALNSQKQKTITVLSCLLKIEEEFGYIPEVAIREIAQFTSTTVNDVWGVATFYPNFQFEPPAKSRIEICWGPACHLMGATKMIDALLKELGIVDEGSTKSQEIDLRFSTCLGACSNGPVITADHELIGRMTANRAVDIVKNIKYDMGHEHRNER